MLLCVPDVMARAVRPGSLGGACGGFLYQARAVAQEHTAQITKQADSPAGLRRKNKMPYALAVLEQLVGLRPEPAPPPPRAAPPR